MADTLIILLMAFACVAISCTSVLKIHSLPSCYGTQCFQALGSLSQDSCKVLWSLSKPPNPCLRATVGFFIIVFSNFDFKEYQGRSEFMLKFLEFLC